MKANFKNVKKIMKMLDEIIENGEYRDFEVAYLLKEYEDVIDKNSDEITEEDVNKMNSLINFRDKIVVEDLDEEIVKNFYKEKENKIDELLNKKYEDLTDEEIETLENRLDELQKTLDYFDRRDKVCCAIDGEQERDEVENKIAQINKLLYEEI